MKQVSLILVLFPELVKAGGMGTSSNNELLLVFLAVIGLVGILYSVNLVLKLWNKPEQDEMLNEEKTE